MENHTPTLEYLHHLLCPAMHGTPEETEIEKHHRWLIKHTSKKARRHIIRLMDCMAAQKEDGALRSFTVGLWFGLSLARELNKFNGYPTGFEAIPARMPVFNACVCSATH